MKLIFLSKLLIRFSRMKARKVKRTLKAFVGDNYPIFIAKAKYLVR